MSSGADLRFCFDSNNPADIPVGAAFVAGYVDGSWGPDWRARGSAYGWDAEAWASFPGSILVRIANLATTDDGHVLDVERGDAEPWEAPGWVQMRRAAGIDPTVYCGIGQWDAVRTAFQDAGVAEPHYWIAHYDNDPTPVPGAVAKQYANATFTHGHYDASVVSGRWPGVEEDMTPEEATQIAVKALADAGLDPNTIEVWKKLSNKHIHAIIPNENQTTGPLVPPVDGAKYAGESADGSQVFWIYPGETTPRA